MKTLRAFGQPGIAKACLAISFIILFSLSAKASLSGTYTIDGTKAASGSNYKTFSSAVSDMLSGTRADGGTANGSGVSAAVVFNVANGTYTEQISITAITGASASNTVTFQSTSGDSSKVNLEYASSGSATNNYVVQLSGANWVNFSKMTIWRTGTSSYGNAIEVQSSASNNSFVACRIFGSKIAATGTQSSVIYSSTDNDTNNIFQGNSIKYGSYSFYWNGVNTSSLERSTQITGNLIDSAYYMAIYSYYEDNMLVSGNTITNLYYTYAYGMNLYYCSNAYMITKNKIIMPNGGNYGIYMNNCYGTSTAVGLIANNMISIGGTVQTYGLYLNWCSYFDVYFNSINLTNTNSSSYGLYNYSFNSYLTDNIVDNNVTNFGGGMAMYVYYYNISTMDYNNWYTTGSTLGTWNGTNYNNLSSWQTASGKDAYALSVNPYYNSPTDLHCSSPIINNAGYALAAVSDDIDGDIRASFPDIGADEFNLPAIDAGVSALTNPAGGYCAGSNSVKVNLLNFGSSKLTSAKINWSVNGTLQTAYSWTGSLVSGAAASINIGSYTFVTGSSYSIKAWSSNPNASTDANPNNDTTYVTNLKQGLSGTYTIGGTTPDYATFGAAVNVLNTQGICGAVTFNVRDGSYNEQLLIQQIPNTSITNTVTFQSQSGDSSKVNLNYASGSSYNYVVQLNGTDYLTFKQITLQRTGNVNNSYGRIIEFKSGACNNVLTGCRILGLKSPYYWYPQELIYSGQDNDSANQFLGNLMRNGTYGFSWYGPNSGSKETGTVIMNNIIDSTLGYGNQFYYQDGLKIKNNRIINLSTGSNSYQVYGLYMQYCDNIKEVSKNNIYIAGASSYSYGIDVQNSNNTSTSPALFSNNMITVDGAAQYGTYGIYEYGCTYHNYYFNSVLIPAASSTSYALYHYDYSGGSQNIVNNCFVNKGGGYAAYVYNFYINTMNYNNWYSGSSPIGYWSGTVYNSLANWKSGTGKDANSISVDPFYASNSNLHVSNVALDKKATPIAGITDDIDGDKRNATKPDIGADEFVPFKTDAGIVSVDSPFGGYCVGAHNVKATIMNYGSDTLKSVTVSWSVNGTAQTPYSWTGSLVPGSRQSLTLGSITFATSSTYTIKVWTVKPNGGADSNALNDTNQLFNLQQGLKGTYTIGGVSPDYVNFSAASTDLMNKGVCGAVLFNARDGSYNEQVYFKNIPNASSTYNVQFQSQSGDSSKVVLYYNSGSWPNNYTVQLIGASYITFSKITISRPGSNFYGNVVELKSGSCNNRFLNCRIIGATNNTTSNYNCLFYSLTDIDSGNWFRNNYMKYGSYDFYWYGTSSTTLETGTVIDGNLMDSAYYTGIMAYYQDGLKVTNNVITNLYYTSPGGANTYGLEMYYCNNALTITGNKINLPYDGYGIYMYFCAGTASAPGYINNNFVTVAGSTTTSYCLYTQYCDYHYYSFNNFLMTNTYQLSYCVNHYGYSSTYVSYFSNNNIVNSGGGFAFYVGNASGIGSSFNNNIYTTGRFLGYWQGTSVATLAAWKSTSGHDTASISVDPYYYSKTTNDLHVFNPKLNGAAIYNPSVKIDIDKQARNTSTPDIGADEFTPAAADAGIVSLTNPYGNFCTANTSVIAKLVNFGTSTLTSATINWTVNGTAQTAYSWTGSLTPGSSASVTIGTYAWSSATVYNVKVYPTSPNGTVDGDHRNDTTYYQNLYCGLQGTYTIGGLTPDYTTFSAVATDLNLRGLCGNVTFNARDGSYNDQIILNQYPNADKYTTVFQSQSLDSSKVELYHASDNSYYYQNYTVLLNGADNITFQKMTIARTGTSAYGRVFQIQKGAHRNRFLSNIIQGVRVLNTNPIELVYAQNDRDTNYIFRNNAFRNGSYAIYMQGLTNNVNNRGFIIQNNTFDSNYYAGIYLYYQDSTVISGNRINNVLSTTGYGIYMYYMYTVMDVNTNKIYLPNGGTGIYLYFWNQNNIAPAGKVYNNFISVGGSGSTAYGFICYWSYNVNFYFNNINIFNSTTSGRPASFQYAWNLKCHNNNFVNIGSGFAVEMLYSNTYSTCGNNNYFTAGKIFGQMNGTFAFTLSDWKTLSGKDSNALSTIPFYKSKSDLHINNKLLDSAAVPMGGIATDIDGDVRNTTRPDIGADEIKVVKKTDAAITRVLVQRSGNCESDPIKIGLVILNNGTYSLNTIPVYASLSGGASGLLSATYSKPLPPGAYDTLFFSTTIRAISTSVNVIGYCAMSGDLDHSNDSFPLKYVITYRNPLPSDIAVNASRCNSGSLKIAATPARSGLRESWYAYDTGGVVLATGDSFTTPSITKTTKYYVQSDGKGHDTIGTSWVNTYYSSDANFIDINTYAPISIDSFDVNMTGSSDTVEVYYKTGSSAGYEGNAAAWTLLGRKYVASPKGQGNPTHVNVGSSLPLTSGKAYAFYIHLVSNSSNLRSSYGYGFYYNPDMTIYTYKEGFGKFTGGYSYPISWSGRIFYSDTGCASKRTPVTANITHGMKGSLWAKGSTFNATYDSGTVTNPDIICTGNTAQYEITPPTGFTNTTYGTKWSISKITMSTVGGSVSNDTSFTKPTTFNNSYVSFTPGATTIGDSVYILNVTVSDSSKSCDSILTRYIYVSPKAKAAFLAGPACLSSTTSFTDSTKYKSFGSLTYTWNFGDTTTSGATNPTHTYLRAGTKTVWLKVSSGSGCGTDSVSKIITIYNPPKSWFGSTSVCSGDSVYFLDSSTVTAPSTIKSRKWYFGDGFTSTAKNPAHLYALVTSYTVSYVVTSSSGCTDSVSRVITPNVKANISVQAMNFCLNDSMRFDDTSVVSQIKSYAWSFGDGGTGTGETPAHLYASSGSYKVKLKVTDVGGCLSSDSMNVTVNPQPSAKSGGNQSACGGSSVTLGASAVAGDTYSWTSKPSGYTSTSSNPSVSPAVNTVYYLTETITSTGCSKTDSAVVSLYPSPAVNAGNDTNTCPGSLVKLGSASVAGFTYSWTSSPSGFTSTTANPSVNPTSTITYYLTEKNTTTTCSASDTITVTVKTVVTGLVRKDTSICKGKSISLGVAAKGKIAYTWFSKPAGFISSVANPLVSPTADIKYYLNYYDSSSGCNAKDSIAVTVNPLPLPAPGTSSLVCSGTMASIGGIATAGHSYSWTSKPAGYTSTSSSGTVYPKVKTVYYIDDSINATGCTAKDSVTINVKALPLAIAGKDTSICDGSAVTIGAAKAKKVGYVWTSSPLGYSSTTSNPTVSPTTTTIYYLASKDSISTCSNYDTVIVTVNSLPSATVGTPKTICVGQSYTIGSTAVGTNTYSWVSKPAGFTSGLSSVSVSPTVTTKYILTEKTSSGCSKQDSVTVTVNPLPVASAGIDDTVCSGSSAKIGSTAKAGFTYSWSSSPSGYSSTSASNTVKPATTTKYYLSVTNSSTACVNYDTVIVNTLTLPTVSAGTDLSTCITTPTVTLSGGSPSKGFWRGTGVTDSTKGIFTPSKSGKGSYTLTYFYKDSTTGCSNTSTTLMYVSGLPGAFFNADTTACKGSSFTFTNKSVKDSLDNWTFGDGNTSSGVSAATASNTYASAGRYTVKLVVTNAYGCTDSVSHSVRVDVKSVPLFTQSKDSICSGTKVNFMNKSTGNIDKYFWNFGNGDTSIIASTTETFSSLHDTVYYIKLSTFNGCGAVSATDSILIMGKPNVAFNVNKLKVCAGDSVYVTDNSKGVVTSYAWDFGNGNTSKLKKPAGNAYSPNAMDKTYSITLKASNSCASDTANTTVTVYANTVKSIVAANIYKGYAPLKVDFHNTSPATLNKKVSYDYGDGSTGPDTFHTFTTAGTYVVKQIVTNGCASDTATVTIDVHAIPTVKWSGSNGICLNLYASFKNITNDSCTSTWSFGDGITAGGDSTSHRYTKAGKYIVKLSVVTALGYSGSYSDTVTVYGLPNAKIYPDTIKGCSNKAITINKSSASDTYSWDFGDSGTATGNMPKHIYLTENTFVVSLIATSPEGCVDSGRSIAVIGTGPVSSFTMSQNFSCTLPVLVNFTNTSSNANLYSWNFGNGKRSVSMNDVASFDSAGAYNVTLVTRNSNGCADTNVQTFNVYPTPKIDFSSDNRIICQGELVKFFNKSAFPAGTATYTWLFGDGDTSVIQDTVEYLYPKFGRFAVSLRTVTDKGCVDTFTKTGYMTVHYKPHAKFTYELALDPFYYGYTNFHTTDSMVKKCSWEFGDGGTSTDVNPSYKYGHNGTFIVKQIVETQFGCKDTITDTVVVDFEAHIDVTTALHRNSDIEQNRYFFARGIGVREYTIRVFNRWGGLVWSSEDLIDHAPSGKWDGTFNGSLCPPDMYMWDIEGHFSNGKEFQDHGVMVLY